MIYSEKYCFGEAGASIEAIEAELAAAVSSRDDLRNDLASITLFLDRTHENAGTEVWWVDLRERTITCGMESRGYALETLIHAENIEAFLRQASLATCDCSEIRVELRTKAARETWENSPFWGRVETFGADGCPVLVVGVRTMRKERIGEPGSSHAPSLPKRRSDPAQEAAVMSGPWPAKRNGRDRRCRSGSRPGIAIKTAVG